MSKKNKKFLSFSLAIKEILDDFRSDPEQYDLFAKVYSFLVGGKAVPGEEECPPMGIKYSGIRYQSEDMKEGIFYNWHEFDDLLTQAFFSKLPNAQNIVKLYRVVMGLNAYIGTDPGKKAGIWVETEMEKYRCIQCGHCCLNLTDAFCTSAHEEDMVRWEEEGRRDILD